MIIVENLVKSYNTTRVLHGVDHSQKRGEAVEESAGGEPPALFTRTSSRPWRS